MPKNKFTLLKTLEEACQFVKEVRICTIFPSDKVEHPSFWDQVDLPEKQPGEQGWGEKTGAVWTWKNELPARYPNEIFYGKRLLHKSNEKDSEDLSTQTI